MTEEVPGLMETIALLQKLHEIQGAIDDRDTKALHSLVTEAEQIVRLMQRNSEEQRRRDSRLHMMPIRF